MEEMPPGVTSLVDLCTDKAIDYLMDDIPDGVDLMVNKLLATQKGRDALKRKAEEIVPIVAAAEPRLAIKCVADLYGEVEGPAMPSSLPCSRFIRVGQKALRLELGCDTDAVGIAIDWGDKPRQEFDWFMRFDFPDCEMLSDSQSGLTWHALFTLLYEQNWHVSVREAWEEWVNTSDEHQCAPFRLNGINELGNLPNYLENRLHQDHSHGCVLVHWRDLIDLLGGPATLVQVLANIYQDWIDVIPEDYENPYEGLEDHPPRIYDVLEHEILDIAGRNPNGLTNHHRSDNLVSDRGQNDSSKRPWLTIVFS